MDNWLWCFLRIVAYSVRLKIKSYFPCVLKKLYDVSRQNNNNNTRQLFSQEQSRKTRVFLCAWCVTVPPTWGYRTPLVACSKVGSERAHDCVGMIQCEWRGIDGTAGLRYRTHQPNGSLSLAQLERPIPWAYTYIQESFFVGNVFLSAIHLATRIKATYYYA